MAKKKDDNVLVFKSWIEEIQFFPDEVRLEIYDRFFDHVFQLNGFEPFDPAAYNRQHKPANMAEAKLIGMINQHNWVLERSEINANNRRGKVKEQPNLEPADSQPGAGPEPALSVSKRDDLVMQAALAYIQERRLKPYTTAIKAWEHNEAAGWMYKDSPIKNRLAWLKGYDSPKGKYGQDAAACFALICDKIPALQIPQAIDSFSGGYYHENTGILELLFDNAQALGIFQHAMEADTVNDLAFALIRQKFPKAKQIGFNTIK